MTKACFIRRALHQQRNYKRSSKTFKKKKIKCEDCKKLKTIILNLDHTRIMEEGKKRNDVQSPEHQSGQNPVNVNRNEFSIASSDAMSSTGLDHVFQPYRYFQEDILKKTLEKTCSIIDQHIQSVTLAKQQLIGDLQRICAMQNQIETPFEQCNKEP